MKIFIAFVVSLAVGSFAYESYLPNSRHPDIVSDKCYLSETGDFIELDEAITPIGICSKFTCLEDYLVLVNQCTRYMQPDNCEIIPRDLTQPFPECCPKLKCIDKYGRVDIRNTTG